MSTPCVLVVDDDDDMRLLIASVFTLGGFRVLEAGSGLDALTALARHPRPDVVVLDVQMPGLDGWETLRAIRTRRGTGDLPVVLCTVRSTAADAARGWEIGCDSFVTKPFDVRGLVESARSVIGRSTDARAETRRRTLVALRAEMARGAERD